MIIDREVLENFSPCTFPYFRSVFRSVATIKDGASCENSQRFSAKIEPFACKTIFAKNRCLTGFWMRLLFSVFWMCLLFSVRIWEFEFLHSRLFQRLGVLNLFQTTISLIMKTNQLTANQIDWFLHERDCCLEWVKKWVQLLRNTWWNFFFLVKLLKYLKISANITCSKSTITTLEEGVKS